MARLPYVESETAPQAIRELLDRLPQKLNVFKMMAHAETTVRPLIALGTAVLASQKLSAKLRELAILRVANLSKASYEWTQHVPIALACGATDAQVAALGRGEIESDAFDAEERLVLRFTDELVHDVKVSDETFGEAVKRFTSREIVELILAVGFYMLVARLLETTAVDLEPPPPASFFEEVKERGKPRPR